MSQAGDSPFRPGAVTWVELPEPTPSPISAAQVLGFGTMVAGIVAGHVFVYVIGPVLLGLLLVFLLAVCL
jgi:hypothetical protein